MLLELKTGNTLYFVFVNKSHKVCLSKLSSFSQPQAHSFLLKTKFVIIRKQYSNTSKKDIFWGGLFSAANLVL